MEKLDFSAFPTLPNLTTLYVWNEDFDDFSFLSRLPSLKKLSIVSCSLSDYETTIETWPALPGLTTLQICSSDFLNLDFLEETTGLETLDIFNCFELDDVSMLNELENLKSVRVNDEGEGYQSWVDEQIDEFAENSPSSCWVGN